MNPTIEGIKQQLAQLKELHASGVLPEAEFLEGKGTPAEVRLFFNGEVVGFGELPHTVPVTFSTTGVSCGEAFFDTIDPTIYEAPFTFTGALDKVVVDISGELIVNPEAEMTRLMTQQ